MVDFTTPRLPSHPPPCRDALVRGSFGATALGLALGGSLPTLVTQPKRAEAFPFGGDDLAGGVDEIARARQKVDEGEWGRRSAVGDLGGGGIRLG